MKVKKKHLTGAIANFPKHVVQKMVDEQVKQGNKADPSVFAHIPSANKIENGFDWNNTDSGRDFWADVIRLKCFHLIPKPTKPSGHPHAKAMRQYAKDAKHSNTPWELWEYQDVDDRDWSPLHRHPCWNERTQYRRKSDNPVEPDTENKKLPTPNEIIKAMLAKGMQVWAAVSDASYDAARERLGKCVYHIDVYEDGTYSPVRTHTASWKYAIPINTANMTEITELP